MQASRRSIRTSSAWVAASAALLIVVAPGLALGAHGGYVPAGHAPSYAMGGPVGHAGGVFGHHAAGGVYSGGGPPFNHLDYNPGVYLGYGVGGVYAYSPALAVVGPGGFAPFVGPGFSPAFGPFDGGGGVFGGGLNLPMPPQAFLTSNPNAARPRRANPARSKELVDIGDRSFRGHNIKRAEEKYNLAVKADPTSPMPHVHLAQVSMARGDYSAAADRLRDAVTVAPDGAWLVNTPDIQAIFGEPADFARQLARLETHLQANPNDRDAWFVLGAEIYLSGRSRQAFDVFQRLTDRRSDEALTAFLDASRPRPAAAN